MHPEKSAVMLVRWWNGDRLQRVRSLRASTHPGVICRGRRHSGLKYPDEKSKEHRAGRYYCTSGSLSTDFCLLNNAAIAVIHATNSIGIINKPFVESAEFLEALESVIIPQMQHIIYLES